MKKTEVVEIEAVEEVATKTKALVMQDAQKELQAYSAQEKSMFASESLPTFYSMPYETIEEKKVVYNLINAPSGRVSDKINEVIAVKDVLAEVIEITDQETGEIVKVPRVVLVDAEGNGYQAVSKGVFNALSRIFRLFGQPTWNEPVEIKVKQIKKGKNSILSLELV